MKKNIASQRLITPSRRLISFQPSQHRFPSHPCLSPSSWLSHMSKVFCLLFALPSRRSAAKSKPHHKKSLGISRRTPPLSLPRKKRSHPLASFHAHCGDVSHHDPCFIPTSWRTKSSSALSRICMHMPYIHMAPPKHAEEAAVCFFFLLKRENTEQHHIIQTEPTASTMEQFPLFPSHRIVYVLRIRSHVCYYVVGNGYYNKPQIKTKIHKYYD